MPNVTYPLDLTGNSYRNFIQREIHSASELYLNRNYLIIPNFAPFYLDNFQVFFSINNVTRVLQENVDYSFTLLYINGSNVVGKPLYGGIILHNVDPDGIIILNYQTIGGNEISNRLEVLEKLNEVGYDPETTTWDILVESQSPQDVNQRYVKKSGDIMEGPLTLVSDPTEPLHAATKQYVDALQFNGQSIDDSVYINRYGDTMEGPLTLLSDPTEPFHAATKQYVDLTLDSFNGLKPGDIIARPEPVTPPGFLRCNGALVSKTDYPDLYAVIGDQFNNSEIYTIPGSGKPWKHQYDINYEQDGDITQWTESTSLPEPLSFSSAVVTKERVYLLGGLNENYNYVSTIYSASINTDGTLDNWSISGNLPVAVSTSQAIVIKNRVYLLGGMTSNGEIIDVYSANINDDGTLGNFNLAGNLPWGASGGQAIVTKSYVYLVVWSTMFKAPINSDGTLGSWSVGGYLPDAVAASQVVITKNRVYLLGGSNSNGIFPTIYTAPINSDGTLGSWTQSGNLPIAVRWSQAVTTKNRVYLLGGQSNYANINKVYSAPINSDGTLGTWSEFSSLPSIISSSQAIITKDKIHLLGGSMLNNLNKVYTASILGGLNDYSPYYDGAQISSDFSDNFTLPDTSFIDGNGVYHYIKY